jgi:C-terminal processing protease CtpA/Prc
MHSQIAATSIAASFLALAGYPFVTAAQADRGDQAQAELGAREQQREAELEAREAQRQAELEARQDAAEHRAANQELERARRELERAAREVARLSERYARPFADTMVRHWQSFGRRAMLGLSPEDTELGVRVAGVSPGGPADDAGIQIGDVITQIDGAALASPRGEDNGRSPTEVLLAQLANVDPGESVTLKVQRDGRDRDVTLRTRESNFFALNPGPAPSMPRWYGIGHPWSDMQLVTLTAELGAYFGTDKGILVVRGPSNDALGLRDGDVILDIGGRVPASPEHAIRILSSFEEGETLRINVMRQQRRQTLELAVPER